MDIKKNKNVEWIDVTKPTEKDLDWLKKKFDLHPPVTDELRKPSFRAHVEATKNYLYFVYYFPLYNTDEETSIRNEIDIVVGKNSVAMVHYESLKGVFDDFEISDCTTSFQLLYRTIEHLLIFEERQLRHIREKVERVGRDLFKNQERAILEQITALKRDISEYHISVRLQEPALKSLLIKGVPFWGKDTETYLNELIGQQMKVVNQVQDYRGTIVDFEETNNQLMNLKINNAIKRLTSLSLITFPLMLFEALFAMNARNTPLVDLPYSFWIITGIIVVLASGLFVFFKKKDLL